MILSELRVALELDQEAWSLTLRARSDVVGEPEPVTSPLPIGVDDLAVIERALDLNGGDDLERTFSAAAIARLDALGLLRRPHDSPTDAELNGRDIHREQLRNQVRRWLADMLIEPLAGAIDQHFSALRTSNPRQHPILYLRLEMRPQRDLPLLRLPWELLHEHRLTKGDIHVGRYLLYDAVPDPLEPAPRLRVLVLQSEPAADDLSPLHLHERDKIIEGLAGTPSSDRLAVEPVEPAGYRTLQNALRTASGQPTIVHFAGHGDFGWRCEQCRKIANTRAGNPCGDTACGFQRHGAPKGFLAFTDPKTGTADWIGISGLRNALKRPDIRLVVLNACKTAAGRGGDDVFNGMAQQLIDIVPAVVATPFPLATDAAEEFAQLLYQEIGHGRSLVEALHQVQQDMTEHFPDEWYRPVLYLRSSQDGSPRLLAQQPGMPSQPSHEPPKITRTADEETEKAAVPESQCSDPTIQTLSDRLQAAYAEHERLTTQGAEPPDLQAAQTRIIELKRRLREGGLLRAGDFLCAGRYKLIAALKQGGFGTIYRAFDTRLRRLVAIKVLHGQYGDDRSRRERFFRGARKMAELQHQGIVQVLDPEQVDEGHWFFVMEYLAGGDLRDAVLKALPAPDHVLDLVLEVGAALAFAHARGLVHRDVKPANIVLDADGRPKLTDFDLVRAGDTTGGTRTGALGTIGYAAPEAMHQAKDVDARADVYGLGMTAIFALRGADPDLLEVLGDRDGLFARLPVADALVAVLDRAIAWKAADRYQTIQAFCAALRQARGQGESHSAIPAVDTEVDSPNSAAPSGTTPFRDPFNDHSGDGPEMIWLPGGTFRMGDGQGHGRENERPVHSVRLDHFAVGKYPLTVGEFRRFVESTGYATQAEREGGAWVWNRGPAENKKDASWRKPYLEQDDRHPVVCISWNDADAYCDWLGKQTGQAYGLLTEAQWEYACRAGSDAAYCFGNDDKDLSDYAWYGDRSASGSTHPVGEKRPNAWLIQDMHGNVWEWCADWYADDYNGRLASAAAEMAGSTTNGSGVRTSEHANVSEQTASGLEQGASENPSGPGSGVSRVIRGGSWNFDAGDCRSASRCEVDPGGRVIGLGFRLSRTGPLHSYPFTLGPPPGGPHRRSIPPWAILHLRGP